MSLRTEQVYADDTDAYFERVITSKDADLTWTPMVAFDGGAYNVAATWQGDPGKTRTLRVPATGLAVGTHRAVLEVPNGTNVSLGTVYVVERS